MDEDEEGKRERRSSALSTGPAYWRALRGGATPLCWIAVVYASRFLRFDSQPASPPLPPRKRAETGGREGRERSGRRKFRTRIVWESKGWKSYDTFIVEMSRNSIKIEKMKRIVFFFPFSCFDYGDERGNKSRYRILVDVIVKCSERTLFPVYFYMLLFLCEDEYEN